MFTESADPRALQLRPDRYALAVSFLTLLAPLWFFSRIPTQDGPLHVDTASVMVEFLGANASFIRSVFDVHFSLETNTLGQYLLMLGPASGLSAEQTEWTFQLLYLTLFAAGTIYFLTGIERDGWRYAPLMLPLAYSYIFHMGFYNNCLSICGFLGCWGALFRHTASPSPRRLLVLALLVMLTWLSHPVGMLGFCAGAAVWCLLERMDGRHNSEFSSLKKTAAMLIVVAAPLVGEGLFLHDRRGKLWEFESWSEKWSQLAQLSMMDSFALNSVREVLPWISGAVAGLFVIGLLASLRLPDQRDKHRALRLTQLILLYLLIYFIAPKEAAGSGCITDRVMCFPLFFLIGVLASCKIVPRIMSIVGSAVLIAFLAAHWPSYVHEARVEQDYLFASRSIPPNSFIYPMHLASHGWDGTGYMSHRADPTVHLAAFYSANNHGIHLNNTIARWREGRQISFRDAIASGLMELPPALTGEPEPVEVKSFEQATGHSVNVVILYGDFSEPGTIAHYYEQRLRPNYSCSRISPLKLVVICEPSVNS